MSNQYEYPMKIYSGKKAASNISHELIANSSSSPILLVEEKKYSKSKILSLFNKTNISLLAIVEINTLDTDPFAQQSLADIIQAFEADSLIIYGDTVLYTLALETLLANEEQLSQAVQLCWIPKAIVNFESTLKIINLTKKITRSSMLVNRTLFIDEQFLKFNLDQYKILLYLTYNLTTTLLRTENLNPISSSFAQTALLSALQSIKEKKAVKGVRAFEGYFLAYSAIISSMLFIELINDFDNKISLERLEEMLTEQALHFKSNLNRDKWFQFSSHYEFFSCVKTMIGHDALEQIPNELTIQNASRPMILATPSIVKRNYLELFTKSFPSSIEVGVIETDVPQDSDFKRVIELAKSYRANKCDSLIVVGGGSYLDTAKGVNILVSEKTDDLAKYSGSYPFTKKMNPLIAVPTTSGTGSEVTVISVIADNEKNQKHVFLSPVLLPDVAILDPRMTESLPQSLTASTAMDALTHAIESYYGFGSNPISASLARDAIKKIFNNIEEAVINPSNLDARLELAIASNMAGIAFSNSMVSMIHSFGHAIGAITHIPHGNCMGILLPYGLEYNLHRVSAKIADLHYATCPNSSIKDEQEAALTFISEIRQLNERLHLATNGNYPRKLCEVLDKNGKTLMQKEQIPEIAYAALNDGSIIYNREIVSISEAKEILAAAWDGVPLDRKKIKKGHQR